MPATLDEFALVNANCCLRYWNLYGLSSLSRSGSRYYCAPPRRSHPVLRIPTNYKILVRTLYLFFSEFLLSDKLRDRPFGVGGPATYQMVLNKCLELLSQFDSLRENICNLTHPGQPRGAVDSTIVNQRLSPALQYVCKYWVYHAQLSQTQI